MNNQANNGAHNPFKPTQQGMEESGFSFLSTPYLGPAHLTDVARDEVNNTPDCALFSWLLHGEDVTGNSVKGSTYDWVEWAPDEDTSTEDIQKKVNRLAYVVRHFVAEEKLLSLEPQGWADYVDSLIQLLEQHDYGSRDDIQVKIPGTVYNGKPRLGFPGYHNFIANSESEKALTWSQKEKQGNAEFLKVQQETPDDVEDAQAVEAVADQEF